MFKVLAGDLTAKFGADGKHLKRYLQRKLLVVRSIVDQLLLHDEILIPTNDYLTAAGLIYLLGERNFIALLEEGRIKFLRTQGVMVYLRGTGADGTLLTIHSSKNNLPQDAPIEDSIRAALSTIQGKYKEGRLLLKLLASNSESLKTSDIVDIIRPDAYRDLGQTALWKETYRHPDQSLLNLPGQGTMHGTLLCTQKNVSQKPVDTLLALAQMNIELYLAKEFDCSSTTTGAPVGDVVSLKLSRLSQQRDTHDQLWKFLDFVDIPDISHRLVDDQGLLSRYLKLTQKRDAEQFRAWFHTTQHESGEELAKEYVRQLEEEPKLSKAPARFIRFAVTTAIDLIPLPGTGTAASVVDTFIVDRLFAGKSPKFFIKNMRRFTGQIKARE